MEHPATDPLMDAADWVVRLSSDSSGEADWLAFQAWLNAADGHRAAYDDALAIWQAVEAHRPTLLAEIAGASLERPRPAISRTLAWGAAMAAGVAVAIALVPAMLDARREPAATAYATAIGERRQMVLEDGSQIDVNGGSRLTMQFTRTARKMVLAGGEIALDVAHDPSRPFTIDVAGRTIRVVGTEFNVLSQGSALKVTVRRGVVRVEPGSGAQGEAVSLPAGREFQLSAEGRATVADANAEDAFAWETGRLIYRDRPLASVVADLNRYHARPVRLEGAEARALHFSGVLTTGDQDEVVGRLTELLPLTARQSEGAIVLSARETGR